MPFSQTLERADRGVVALENAGDRLAVGAQHVEQEREQQLLDPLDPDRERLRHEDVRKAVDRQPREAVGLAENHTAAAEILRAQHGFAVVPGVLHAPPPEGLVEAVVGVAGEEAQADLALAADEARAEILALLAHRVGERAVFARALLRDDLLGVDPGVPALDPARALRGHDEARICPISFHFKGTILSHQKASPEKRRGGR